MNKEYILNAFVFISVQGVTTSKLSLISWLIYLYSQNMYNSMFSYERNVSTFYVHSVSTLKITHARFPIIVQLPDASQIRKQSLQYDQNTKVMPVERFRIYTRNDYYILISRVVCQLIAQELDLETLQAALLSAVVLMCYALQLRKNTQRVDVLYPYCYEHNRPRQLASVGI